MSRARFEELNVDLFRKTMEPVAQERDETRIDPERP